MTEEKKADGAASAAKESVATPVAGAAPAIPPVVDPSKTAAPVVLPQAPAIARADAKPAVVAPPLADKK